MPMHSTGVLKSAPKANILKGKRGVTGQTVIWTPGEEGILVEVNKQQVSKYINTCDECSKSCPVHQWPADCPGWPLVPSLPTAQETQGLTFNERLPLDGTTAEGLKPKQTLPAAL